MWAALIEVLRSDLMMMGILLIQESMQRGGSKRVCSTVKAANSLTESVEVVEEAAEEKRMRRRERAFGPGGTDQTVQDMKIEDKPRVTL